MSKLRGDLWLLLPGWVASRIFFIGVATCGPLNALGGTPQKQNVHLYYAVVKYRLREKYGKKEK